MHLSRFLPVTVAGTGHALPRRQVTSAQIDARLGLAPGTLEKQTGVVSRHVAEGESQIDLAETAARAALQEAGIDPSGIDLVLGACGVPYQAIPATAPLVMARLGIADGQAAAFDVNATCLSFLNAFELAARQIAAGVARAALIVSADLASRGLPWDDQPDVAALFGDGAAAAVLTATPDGAHTGLRAALMQTHASAYNACQLGAGGTRFDFHTQREEFARHSLFHMDGRALFRLTGRRFPAFIETLLARAGWRLEEVDLMVPHQASPFALDHILNILNFPAERTVNIGRTLGNQIAASIPTALDIARRDGRAAPGRKLLLLGTSAGVSFGGLALEV